MKKILCLMLAFLLCFSVCATAEENAGEEAVSNTVTYGPVSFDISDKWVETDYRTQEHWIDATFNSSKKPDVHLWFSVRDSWNSDFTEEQKKEAELIGLTQEECDFVEIAQMYLEEAADDWPMADPEKIEIIRVGEYEFCRLVPHFLLDLNNRLCANPAVYYAYINGYSIGFFFFGSIHSAQFADFTSVLTSFDIGIVDKVP